MTDSTKRDIVAELIAYVQDECTATDQEARYDELLDELYPDLPGPLEGMLMSRVLKEVSPITYRCGLNDYYGTDSELFEIGDDCYDRDEVEEARERFVSDLEDELSEVEADAAEGMLTDGPDVDDDDRVIELRELIETAKRYVF